MAAPSSMRRPRKRESCSAARACGGYAARRSSLSVDPPVRTSMPPTAKCAATDTTSATISEANRNPYAYSHAGSVNT